MKASVLLALLPIVMAAPSKRAFPAPVLVPRDAQLVEGKYIIKMKSGAGSSSVSSAISSIAADADQTYTHSFKGFAASLSPQELEKLRNDPNVSCGLSSNDEEVLLTHGIGRLY
jgi:hypothetical protein